MKSLILAFTLYCAGASAGTTHGPAMGHLSFFNSKIHAHLMFEAGPFLNSESKLSLEWHDGKTHALIDPGQKFEVELYMPAMGHGSAPTQIQATLDANGQPVIGTYSVSGLYFTMTGAWEVRVTLSSADGTQDTQAWAVMIDRTSRK